jgi:hypothetical protein
VNETPEQMRRLQRLLDDSMATRGPQLDSIATPERRLTATQLVTALDGMKVLVVATVTSAGEPRTSCVDGHFLHGEWVFSTDASAYKARHIRARPAVSATHVDGERLAVFAHGRADYIGRGTGDYDELDAYFERYYGSRASSWGPEIVFFRLHAAWMLGFAMEAASFPSS